MYILIFLISMSEMIYELVTARAMAPYYGNGNYTMTAIIAIMLLSGSLGNVIGGRLTKNKSKYNVLSTLFITAGLTIVASKISISYLSALLNSAIQDMRISVMICSLIFFFPALVMGIFTPIAMDDILSKFSKENIGEQNGKIHGLIAIGSLAGTILGGFVLIPVAGTTTILFGIAIFMIIMSAIYSVLSFKQIIKGTSKKIQLVTSLLPAICGLFILCFLINSVDVNKTFQNTTITNEMSFDTAYDRILVYDTINQDGEPIRMYRQGNAYASATFLDPEKKYEPVFFEYISTYEVAHKFLKIQDALMIGGAAYQYPKYFISTHPECVMDVVEINGESEKIARKYFFLDDLIEEYGEEHINCITDDGRLFLQHTNKKYDAIFNDAFSGGTAVPSLCTVEFAQLLKSRLNPNGVYLSNTIGSLSGDSGRFIRSEVKTLRQVFRHVYVISVNADNKADDVDNWIIVATDNEYHPDRIVDVLLQSDDYILTDDFCPVEILSAYNS